MFNVPYSLTVDNSKMRYSNILGGTSLLHFFSNICLRKERTEVK